MQDYIPAVGDIDAFIKVPRPDGIDEDLGKTILVNMWSGVTNKQEGSSISISVPWFQYTLQGRITTQGDPCNHYREWVCSV